MDISERHIQTLKGMMIGSFSSKDLQSMYHFPNPQCVYNTKYVKAFIKENGHLLEKIRQWWKDPNKHKDEENGKYSIDSLTTPFSQVAAMVCQLHALPNVSKFPNTWVPLVDGAIEGFIFD